MIICNIIIKLNNKLRSLSVSRKKRERFRPGLSVSRKKLGGFGPCLNMSRKKLKRFRGKLQHETFSLRIYMYLSFINEMGDLC